MGYRALARDRHDRRGAEPLAARRGRQFDAGEELGEQLVVGSSERRDRVAPAREHATLTPGALSDDVADGLEHRGVAAGDHERREWGGRQHRERNVRVPRRPLPGGVAEPALVVVMLRFVVAEPVMVGGLKKHVDNCGSPVQAKVTVPPPEFTLNE